MTFAPERLESALARVQALDDPAARAAAQDAVAAILALQGEGLTRLCERLRETCDDGATILEALSQDRVVASLFLLHGLHPLPLGDRVERAVASLRLADDGKRGRVEVVAVKDTRARLRVSGSERFRREVVRAVEDAAPELERVELLEFDPLLVPIARLTRKPDSQVQCDLCAQPLAPEHEHLFDIDRRRLQCACVACAILFDSPASRVRRVRPRARALDNLEISEATWSALEVPVKLAFFSYASSIGEVVAAYPGPAGLTESLVSKSAWNDLIAQSPELERLAPDTSALLVDRLSAEPSYHILSIDACYRLTGLIRSRWKTLTDGDGPARAIRHFVRALAEGHG